ncbi:MAG: segregation/condensation protein A [Cyanobacteria bacterium TGS_CYA1]|nr:segregation/condensation protein A [Cyanobacteria bacterium TGS_CYA1]MDX2108522.1 segregation/condensation protein A [Candidatus Melainabacteria bacterium]
MEEVVQQLLIDPLTLDPVALEQEANIGPSDGIEILVRMAKNGEIDAKSVDIIDVTDKFLKAIAATPKESLRQSGKIIFHASVLLRLKAESLLVEVIEEEKVEDDFMDFDEGAMEFDGAKQPRQISLTDLEKAIVRKPTRTKVVRRKITLDELIKALQEAEKIEKTRSEKSRKSRIDLSGHTLIQDVDDILNLAHDEDIESTIENVEQLLVKIFQANERIELFALVGMLDRKSTWVDAFLASLFLSNAGKIQLEQESFYGPVFITQGK